MQHLLPHPGARSRRATPDMDRARRDLVIACVSRAFAVPQRAISRPGRGKARHVLARQAAIYLLHVVFSMPLQRLAALFRKDRTTISHACQCIEDRRDDAAFDAFLHDLELAVSALDSAVQLRTKHEQGKGAEQGPDEHPAAHDGHWPLAAGEAGQW